MSFAIAILGLLLLIFIHELGHFGAAKLVGMRALNFTIGFPPILVGKKWGDTEYRIGLIPLGGYGEAVRFVANPHLRRIIRKFAMT